MIPADAFFLPDLSFQISYESKMTVWKGEIEQPAENVAAYKDYQPYKIVLIETCGDNQRDKKEIRQMATPMNPRMMYLSFIVGSISFFSVITCNCQVFANLMVFFQLLLISLGWRFLFQCFSQKSGIIPKYHTIMTF